MPSIFFLSPLFLDLDKIKNTPFYLSFFCRARVALYSLWCSKLFLFYEKDGEIGIIKSSINLSPWGAIPRQQIDSYPWETYPVDT